MYNIILNYERGIFMPNTTMSVLDKVNAPDDLKKLNFSELSELAEEMRELIIKKVNTIGGHFGPNLGIVETAIALHYYLNWKQIQITKI